MVEGIDESVLDLHSSLYPNSCFPNLPPSPPQPPRRRLACGACLLGRQFSTLHSTAYAVISSSLIEGYAARVVCSSSAAKGSLLVHTMTWWGLSCLATDTCLRKWNPSCSS